MRSRLRGQASALLSQRAAPLQQLGAPESAAERVHVVARAREGKGGHVIRHVGASEAQSAAVVECDEDVEGRQLFGCAAAAAAAMKAMERGGGGGGRGGGMRLTVLHFFIV